MALRVAMQQQLLRRSNTLLPTAFAIRSAAAIQHGRRLQPIECSFQARYAATQNMKPEEGYNILAQQRLNRPVSPHLGIYQPQITWINSGLNRVTGSIMSGGFYIFGFGYLVAPLFGMHWESHAMVAAFGSLSPAVKMGLKFSMALPFTFHVWNSMRHLVWDTGSELRNQQVIWTGWAVWGLTVVSTGYLAVM